jgi:large subunit ribosomal protein L23
VIKVRSKETLSRVLIAPLVSEKATRSGDRENSVAFWVNPKSTKGDIKQAVELFFSVTVESVRTMVKGRCNVRFGQTEGRTKKRKKAYVKLAAGQEINLQDLSV